MERVPPQGSSGKTPRRGGLIYHFSKLLCKVAARLLFDVLAYGTRHIPRRGPCLLAANHQSFIDPFVVGLCVPGTCHYLARDSLFRVPLLGRILRHLKGVPVARGTAASRGALEAAVSLLRAGEAMLLFPEGTRSADGRLQPYRRGVALVAKRSGAPVVPVLVAGSFAVWPRHRRLPRLSPRPRLRLTRPAGGEGAARGLRRGVRVFFGEAIAFEPGESSDEFTGRLRAAHVALAAAAGCPEIAGETEAEEKAVKKAAGAEQRDGAEREAPGARGDKKENQVFFRADGCGESLNRGSRHPSTFSTERSSLQAAGADPATALTARGRDGKPALA